MKSGRKRTRPPPCRRRKAASSYTHQSLEKYSGDHMMCSSRECLRKPPRARIPAARRASSVWQMQATSRKTTGSRAQAFGKAGTQKRRARAAGGTSSVHHIPVCIVPDQSRIVSSYELVEGTARSAKQKTSSASIAHAREVLLAQPLRMASWMYFAQPGACHAWERKQSISWTGSESAHSLPLSRAERLPGPVRHGLVVRRRSRGRGTPRNISCGIMLSVLLGEGAEGM
mmetsp:Transcript_92153/g.286849  ORF Transcript_92153/g.286849 Transcript_92153/m.286849 type:complete len:229 (+) Transcript_92153:1135-1821(+)